MLYEGTSEIHELLQAGYALGTRHDTPLRRELPGFPFEGGREPGAAHRGDGRR